MSTLDAPSAVAPSVPADAGLSVADLLDPPDAFAPRHLGPDEAEVRRMLEAIGCDSLDTLADEAVPEPIRLGRPLELPPALSEREALGQLARRAAKNQVRRSLIGQGYHGTVTPPVILRNVLENPGWYTQYTPYQAEISQGRLEALLNFQQAVADLTALPLANASLLDEATAAAEAMAMCKGIAGRGGKNNVFLVDAHAHPQTIGVLKTRAGSMGIDLRLTTDFKLAGDEFGVFVQHPTTFGEVRDDEAMRTLCDEARGAGAMTVFACDPLALAVMTPPGELGADLAVGSAQRLGVPMGFGGPHAAFIATSEKHVRKLPGRLVGVSVDAHGDTAYRLTLQTREQHIRRDKATSNICTAQVLLAVMAGAYCVYHGPAGVRRIAERTHALTLALAAGLTRLGHEVVHGRVFDTVRVKPAGLDCEQVVRVAATMGYNLRDFENGSVGISLDEESTREEVERLIECFAGGSTFRVNVTDLATEALEHDPLTRRASDFLTHPVFNKHHSEHEMLRYLTHLQGKDLSLAHGMIPLGSCTMKLNATSEMLPVSWPAFAKLHPYAPAHQAAGYFEMADELKTWLCEITGFDAVSLQPNAGSQGEYAGLLAIRRYHGSRGESHRDVCLIPDSAHGTNPASAVIAGMRVVVVKCKPNGDIDLDDLTEKAEKHKENLAALMVTYPSTHGVFEADIKDVCQAVHDRGGQVYMDGANMNAQVGLCRPGDFGADVCHLNLHKTFCIPHGGGGPGVGPIGVAAHLAPFLPGSPTDDAGQAVSAAPLGSAGILPISWMYIAMMGPDGLRRATQIAVLAANYMAERLKDHYDVLFTGPTGRVAHEFVIDCRPFTKSADVSVEDIAKRLMDYGFHAPTMSWPVSGTLMIEPTESESLDELDRFCDAMISIREEIRRVERGEWDKADNPLQHAPHTAASLAGVGGEWSHAYDRETAAYPSPATRQRKFWPSVGRVDNVHGDRNVVCTCPPISDYEG